jgi:ERCC4-type nuclease
MLQEHFKKFYDMKPYLLIEEEEWKDIMQKYEKEDVVEELAKVLHTYPAPLPEITDKQTLDSLNKLKGIKHNDVLVEKRWFPRNERKSNYHLNYKDSQFLLKRNNSEVTMLQIRFTWKIVGK